MTLTSFHPAIQSSILHFANPELSFADIGQKMGISKQAVAKQIKLGASFFSSYGSPPAVPEKKLLEQSKKHCYYTQRQSFF